MKTQNKPPATFEELRQIADSLRASVQEGGAGLRWCWIAYYRDDNYYLGVQYEGQCWWHNCGLLQEGRGKKAHDWIRRLNEREGLSEETEKEIQNSISLSVRASLNEDETEVWITVDGAFPGWDVAPSTIEMARQFDNLPEFPSAYPKPIRLRTVFTLEDDMANDLRSCLASLVEAKRLPIPSRTNSDIDVVQDEESGNTTFIVPGKMEIDPLDNARFTLVIDLQTAADLFRVINEKFIY